MAEGVFFLPKRDEVGEAGLRAMGELPRELGEGIVVDVEVVEQRLLWMSCAMSVNVETATRKRGGEGEGDDSDERKSSRLREGISTPGNGIIYFLHNCLFGKIPRPFSHVVLRMRPLGH